MANGPIAERNRGKYLLPNLKYIINIYLITDATIYVGGLDDKVTESLLWELFVQSGPLGNLYLLCWNFLYTSQFCFSQCPHAQRSSYNDAPRIWFCGIHG